VPFDFCPGFEGFVEVAAKIIVAVAEFFALAELTIGSNARHAKQTEAGVCPAHLALDH
jgi:hypothetical protein